MKRGRRAPRGDFRVADFPREENPSQVIGYAKRDAQHAIALAMQMCGELKSHRRFALRDTVA